MTISVIFTGGTIGSLTKKEWMGIDDATNYMLLSRFENSDNDVVFQTSAPYSVLSENLSAEELNRLQSAVQQELEKHPDGIIVTHGTDTLQYTAAALEYAFADADIPVVLVSADYPLDHEQTNGYINFEAAVAFIKSRKAKGVFVSYRNSGAEKTNIHIASRLLQHGEGAADVYSIGEAVYATYDGTLTVTSELPDRGFKGLGAVSYHRYAQILAVESAPGNDYAYSLDGIKAIILKPYHSATLNTMSEELAALCRRAQEAGIPVFVSGVKTGIGYESSKLFGALNITVAPYSTYIALYMKVWAAISLGKDVTAFVNTPLAHEWAE